MPHSRYANGMAVLRWTVAVPGGLDGKVIGFAGLPQARIDVLARMARADGTVQLERILAVDPQFTVKPSPGAFEVVRTYTVLGIEHILTGFDHLLFVLALVIIVRGTKRLLWTVTAFTVAHSITLALATLGIIHVPGPPVEAMIALSIVFVASEIVQQQRGREGLASTQPWLVAFTFGLLHGLGFAGALAQVGLPENSIPLALLFFNVGVEIGQLLFIVAVLAAMRLATRLAGDRLDLRRGAIVSAYAIGTLASYWTIERISSFWS
jgi:hydrogenase/urease accessory protein HupE